MLVEKVKPYSKELDARAGMRNMSIMIDRSIVKVLWVDRMALNSF